MRPLASTLRASPNPFGASIPASTVARSPHSCTGPRRKFSGPRPVLIDIHGGPEETVPPRFLGRLNYLINELGIVVIFPNVRGSSGYGKSYLKLDNG